MREVILWDPQTGKWLCFKLVSCEARPYLVCTKPVLLGWTCCLSYAWLLSQVCIWSDVWTNHVVAIFTFLQIIWTHFNWILRVTYFLQMYLCLRLWRYWGAISEQLQRIMGCDYREKLQMGYRKAKPMRNTLNLSVDGYLATLFSAFLFSAHLGFCHDVGMDKLCLLD